MSKPFSRQTLTGGTLAVLAVLLVAIIILSNQLLRGVQVDLTQNKLYTLTSGTRQILAELKEPVNLYLFFSDQGTEGFPQIRTYAIQVRELLEEVARQSAGKVRLQVIDPMPFSEEEDRASAFGLQAIPTGNGEETIFFGLAGTNATDGQMAIPFFQPNKESFLEYDVAKLIHGLTLDNKPVVGVISGLKMGPDFDQATRQIQPGWATYRSWQELFDLRMLNAAGTTQIDGEIKTLLLVHPKNLSEDTQYAIDQFVLRGGKLLVFVDPNAEMDSAAQATGDPSAAGSVGSDLPRLFKAWGVEYNPAQVLLDAQNALTIQDQTGKQVRHAAILGMHEANLNQTDPITAQLSSINFSTAGVIRMAQDAPLVLTPLVQSSAESMLVEAERVKYLPDPAALLDGFVASKNHYVVAGLLEGKLKTAFAERGGPQHLAESKEPAHIMVIADTDVLTDRLWVMVQNVFGQQIMNAFANNGDFAGNAVDQFAGSPALINIRGRGASARPFTTVEALRHRADERYRATERQLNQELAETEQKLNELQQGKSDQTSMVLSPEQKAELERFQKRKLEIRKELRKVRRQLDADIEDLGWRLKVINIFLVPALLVAVVLVYRAWRRRRAVPRMQAVGEG